MHLPFHRLTYTAVAGEGAFVHDEGKTTRLAVSDKVDFAEMDIALTRNHYSGKMTRIMEYFGFRSMVRRGSVGLKIGLIATRECDIYIHPSPRTKLWDTCGPQIILEEAGGRLTDLFGGRIVYNDPDVRNLNGLIATNGTAHDTAIAKLRPLLDEFERIPA